jgi:hypothetical protein
LAPGKFSDAKFKLRRNKFLRQDSYISSLIKIIEEFYDIIVYNYDIFDVD